MPDNIESGRMFVREGAFLPETLQLAAEPYAPGWNLVKNVHSGELDRHIREVGWTFFFLAGEIRASALRRQGQQGICIAVKRILAKLKSSECNAVEIIGVAPKHFLGVPYVTVFARSRHIQESVFLFRAEDLPKWERAKLAA